MRGHYDEKIFFGERAILGFYTASVETGRTVKAERTAGFGLCSYRSCPSGIGQRRPFGRLTWHVPEGLKYSGSRPRQLE
jgi:hypothetical protein